MVKLIREVMVLVIEENLFKKLGERVQRGEKAALAIVTETGGSTPGKPGIMMAVFENGETIGTVGGGRIELEATGRALECIESGESRSFKFELEGTDKSSGMFCGGSSTIFIRSFNPKPKLVIVGAGHVSLSLSKVAATQSFEVHIVDNREELCNRERFPEAEKLHLGDIAETLKSLEIGTETYIVIAGPNHELDEKSLESVLSRGARYIGMLGSKKKVEKIREHILERGGLKEDLDQVYTPIGIDIGSNIPSEIAVGIMAEIIMVKNKTRLE
jgi:xanthine dehydrogenase accessory factor